MLSEQTVKRIAKEAEEYYHKHGRFAHTPKVYSDAAISEATRSLILLEALEKICNPIKSMQDALEEGERLDGRMAIMLSSDAVFLKDIARKAIASYNNNKETK